VTNACTFEVAEEDDNMASQGDELRGWAQTGNLFTGAGTDGTGKGGAVTLQAKLSRPDSLTTQFNVSGPFANIRAEIISDVNGNDVRRLISVVDGMSITTRGKTIKVKVKDYTTAGISDNEKYTVSILSTLGVRAGFKQPPYLTPLEYEQITPVPVGPAILPVVSQIPLGVGGGTVDVAIPPDAGVNSVYVSMISEGQTIPYGELIVEHQIGAVIFQAYDPREHDWVPLYPGSTNVRLINFSATLEASAMVFFGIDG
jgi:hypothetical protein